MSVRTTENGGSDGASRAQVLGVLRAEGRAMTIDEVAGRLGRHANTVRRHLDHLAGTGLATREPHRGGGRGRPRLVYAAVPVPEFEPAGDGVAGADSGFRLLAEILAGHLESTAPDPSAEAATAGRTWGRLLARRLGTAAAGGDAGGAAASVDEALEELGRFLDRLDFAPGPAGAGQELELHHCPFGQVAQRHSSVVCAVHLGLMQGALTERGAPVRAASIEPFIRPDTCIAHLDTVLDRARPPAEPAWRSATADRARATRPRSRRPARGA